MVTRFLSLLCYFYILDAPFACTLCKDCNSPVKQACEHARYEVHCQARYFVYYCVWLIILGACFLHISRLLFVCFVFHVIRNGTISHHYASTLTEMLTDIQNATFSCVVCDANGIVLFPRLSEILRLGDIRLPTRVPLSCLVLLRELGHTPSILNEHREYYFTH